ncbi:MAG: glycosyltransferase family 39 protein [Candidatus Omnitrophota bacterium]
MNKKIAYTLLVLAVAIFLWQTLKFPLTSPSVTGGEAEASNATLKFLNNIKHGECQYITFLGRRFPINIGKRHGALEIYVMAPFVALSDFRLERIRIVTVLFAVLTIIFVFILAKVLFNRTIAVISVILIAINQYFIVMMRFSITWGLTVQLFSVIPVLLMYKFYTTKKQSFFYWGMFMLGLGLNARGHYVWFIFGFLVSAYLFFRHFMNNKKRILFFGCCFFFIGCLPVLLHYASDPGFKKFVMYNFPITHGYSLVSNKEFVNNTHFFQNLILRFDHILRIVFNARGNGSYRLPYFLLFGACVSLTFYKFFRKRPHSFNKRRILFIFSLFVLTLVGSCVTFTLIRDEHLLMLTPYVVIIVAVMIYEMFKDNIFYVSRPLSVIFLSTIIFSNITSTEKFLPTPDDNLSFVTQWLIKNNVKKVIASNYIIDMGIEFYSGLKLDPYPCPTWREENKKKICKKIIENSKSDVAFVARKGPIRTAFNKLLKRTGKTMHEALDTGGYIVYVIE